MAEESEDGQEKTEEPSQRKIEKAREDGKVLSSKEMFVFTNIFMALVVMFGMFLVAKQYLFEWADLFVFDADTKLDDLASIKTSYALWYFLKVSLLVGTPVFLVTIGTQLAVGGFNFAPKAMSFKGSKLNPIKGMKNIISVKSLVELGKSILKVVLLMSASAYAIYWAIPEILRIPDGSLGSALSQLQNIFPLLLISSLVALAIIAALDYFWQRHQHMESLKMTRKEQKDEFKQTEGSPEVKQKIRQKQIQASMAAAEAVSSNINKVEDVANALFDEWADELEQYSSDKLKRQSARQLSSTQRQFERLLRSMRSSEAKMQPVLDSLQDNVLYLKHNLNAQAISAIKGEFTGLKRDISALIADMNRSIEDSNKFIAEMNANRG